MAQGGVGIPGRVRHTSNPGGSKNRKLDASATTSGLTSRTPPQAAEEVAIAAKGGSRLASGTLTWREAWIQGPARQAGPTSSAASLGFGLNGVVSRQSL